MINIWPTLRRTFPLEVLNLSADSRQTNRQTTDIVVPIEKKILSSIFTRPIETASKHVYQFYHINGPKLHRYVSMLYIQTILVGAKMEVRMSDERKHNYLYYFQVTLYIL